MPAKKVVNKEKVIETALQIVKESGIDALNMRTLAKRCNCSTQPLYNLFDGIDEIVKEVSVAAANLFEKYQEDCIANKEYSPYKAVGMGYVRFAKEQSELYRFLFMDSASYKKSDSESFEQSVGILTSNFNISRELAIRLHMEMWIFVHGIATLSVTHYLNLDYDVVSDMLTDVFIGVLNKFKGENNGN